MRRLALIQTVHVGSRRVCVCARTRNLDSVSKTRGILRRAFKCTVVGITKAESMTAVKNVVKLAKMTNVVSRTTATTFRFQSLTCRPCPQVKREGGEGKKVVSRFNAQPTNLQNTHLTRMSFQIYSHPPIFEFRQSYNFFSHTPKKILL